MRWTLLLLAAGCPAISDADLEERRDRDGDGFQAAALGGTDCNDDDRAVHPGAAEVCDGIDNDCDGLVNADDPGAPGEEVDWYLDADGDGWGSDLVYVRSCFRPETGWVHHGGDCDDTDPDQVPGQRWFLDGDGDGWGLDDDTPRVQCERPDAHALTVGDCDDANALVHPTAVEVCNAPAVDDDCDGLVDEADPDLVATDYYPDVDRDGFGEDDAKVTLCAQGDHVQVDGDCDDGDPEVHPAAAEIWYDGVDQNCDQADDYDQDGDGEASDGHGGLDCDDARAWVHPGAPEICNGQADDCDPAGWDPSEEAGLAHFVAASGATPLDFGAILVAPGAVANVAEDGTLSLCPGSWTGAIVVSNGEVLVRAPGGLGSAVLDAAGGPGIVVVGPQTHVVIEGLEVTNGTGHDPGGFGLTEGGCLYADAGSLELRDADLHGCSATLAGGVASITAAEVAIRDTTLRDGSAGDGGGAWILADALTIERTTIEASSATNTGGGLFLSLVATDALLADLTLAGNDAIGHGGGLFVQRTGVAIDPPTLFLLRPVIGGNVAGADGGGVFFGAGLASVVLDGAFAANTAGGAGGGLRAGSPVDLVDTAITDNAASAGGGIHAASRVGCRADDGVSVVHRNSGNGVNVANGGAFEADPCDFSDGADDNTPHDVVAGASPYTYGAAAVFTCTPTACAP